MEQPNKQNASFVLDVLLTRKSIPALALTKPGPDTSEIESMLKAAHRAVDHGRLRPWRLFVIPENLRPEFLNLWLESLKRMAPDTTKEKLAAKRKAYASPPVVIVVGVKIERPSKISETEQIISAGCAVQNVLNAAHAMGYGAILLSGKAVLDEQLKANFELDKDDYLLGVIYVGTPRVKAPAPELNTDDRIFEWKGSGAE